MSDDEVLELGDIALRSGLTAGETDLSFTVLKRALIALPEARVRIVVPGVACRSV